MNLALLNVILPAIISLYKQIRDSNPNQPAMTDAQIIDLLHTDSTKIVAKANTWLAAHPPATNPAA